MPRLTLLASTAPSSRKSRVTSIPRDMSRRAPCVQVGSPRANSPACTPPAADGSSVASDGYDTDCWYARPT